MKNETDSQQYWHYYCHIFPDDPHKCDVIIGLRRGLACFSLIGCLFIIFVVWLFRKYQALVQRLILYLSISALFMAIAYLMGGLRPDGPMCDLQAWWITYFEWTTLLWVSCITFNLFMNIVYERTTERYEWFYHILSWGFPILLSVLPFIGNHYGPAGAWCWIKENTAWRMGIWYGPLFIIIALLIAAYSYVTVILSRKSRTWEGTYDPDSERKKRLLKDDIKPLRAYPFIYLAVSIFPLIHRIQNAAAPESPVFALLVLAAISSPIQGALNAIVFGLDKDTFKRLRPAQIKLAFQGHFAPRAVIREYPQSSPCTDSDRQTLGTGMQVDAEHSVETSDPVC